MRTFLAALVFVGLAVLLLGVNIFFFHRPFPDGEISTNPEMQKRGISRKRWKCCSVRQAGKPVTEIIQTPAQAAGFIKSKKLCH